MRPISGEHTGAAKILALTKLANRINKDMLKFSATQELNCNTASNYYFPFTKMKNFSHLNRFYYDTGKIATYSPETGNYADIMQSIRDQPPEIAKKFVARMFGFIRAENLNDKTAATWITSGNYNSHAEQIAHLFFIEEMQRNVSSLFTAPMFLELVANDQNFSIPENFPMALPGAVDKTRDMLSAYANFLTNHNYADYGQYQKGESLELLDSTARLIMKWYSSSEGKNLLLSNIIIVSQCISRIQAFFDLKVNIQRRAALEKYKEIKKALELIIIEIPLKAGLIESLSRVIAAPPVTKRKVAEGRSQKTGDDSEFVYSKELLNGCMQYMDKFIRENNMNLKIEMIKFIQILSQKLSQWYRLDVPSHLQINIPPKEVLDKLMEPENVKEEKTDEAICTHPSSGSWREYIENGIKETLKLRLESIGKQTEVTIADTLSFDGTDNSALDIARKLSNIEINDKLLAVLDIYNKYPVGIIIEKSDSLVKIIYIDCEQKFIPYMLKKNLFQIFSDCKIKCEVDIIEAKLDIHEYNSCGLEIIENFVSYLTKDRLIQDDTLVIHPASPSAPLEHGEKAGMKFNESNESSFIEPKLLKCQKMFSKLIDIHGEDKVFKLGELITHTMLSEIVHTQNSEFLAGVLSLD